MPPESSPCSPPVRSGLGGRAWRAAARLPRATLVALVRGYQLLLSPMLGPSCRFDPCCSQYALEALQRHGALAGSYLATRRILRCHPWCAGGCDPVPEQPPRLFRGLVTPSSDRPPT